MSTLYTNKAKFIDELGVHPESMTAKTINELSNATYAELLTLMNAETDTLIHLDFDKCSINHGSVGSRGISYEFKTPTF